MPSVSPKQKHFFQAVKRAKHDPNYGDARIRKVASSMSDSDIDDFANSIAEFKTKKAMLGILKDIREPMYLEEENDATTDIVSSTFHVKENWSKYIKSYIGQPFSQKELESLETFKEKSPSTVSRTEIWYKTTDTFSISKTTVIKKMKDSGQYSFSSFQKQEKPSPEDKKPNNNLEPPSVGENPEMPQGSSSPGTPIPPEQQEEKPEEKEKEDIIVTKSILFKDDIKGASILVEFLKKIDL